MSYSAELITQAIFQLQIKSWVILWPEFSVNLQLVVQIRTFVKHFEVSKICNPMNQKLKLIVVNKLKMNSTFWFCRYHVFAYVPLTSSKNWSKALIHNVIVWSILHEYIFKLHVLTSESSEESLHVTTGVSRYSVQWMVIIVFYSLKAASLVWWLCRLTLGNSNRDSTQNNMEGNWHTSGFWRQKIFLLSDQSFSRLCFMTGSIKTAYSETKNS